MHDELPVDVALGKVDYYEAVGFSDHRATNAIWYRLLNCGFRLSAGAGTDAMTNFASLRGPVGMDRVYVHVSERSTDPVARRAAFLAGLRAGHTFATNGPLLGFSLQDQGPGGELELPPARIACTIVASMRSIAPIDHVEVVRNGEVVANATLAADHACRPRSKATSTSSTSGWLLLRAWNDSATPEIFDIYPYATTNPVYVSVGDEPVRSSADAAYFLSWIDDLIAAARRRLPATTQPRRRARRWRSCAGARGLRARR